MNACEEGGGEGRGGEELLFFSRVSSFLSWVLLSLAHFANWSCALMELSSFRIARYSAWSFFCSLKALDVGVGRLLYRFHSYTPS